ncbi:hypothetical protein [Actinokineospora sp. NBRC 105648]|uniref:hypothetical protein n=1 Tax=Actinokineospora sp. NBRC 105648 TaxID=3032206 RepID=UPI0024A2985F|nr:hypothetical protein [Actinokineospora sp. NBRC 105648]GLZ39542.1 hypothetical protein Acsp05_31660 [Actinokineospora sp. NBRC 105648]
MRLIRVGESTAAVGKDLRAALTSWQRGDAVAGGIALLGITPPGLAEPVEAVVLLPRGVLVVTAVDLPDPAMRLEAPLGGQWKTDGWPLVHADGPVNPADGALAATAAVAGLVRAKQPVPLPVYTVVAVGPYVAEVAQPEADVARGVRILHPEPMPLLALARELATQDRPCPVGELRRVLAALHPELRVADAELVAEGFPDGLSAESAAERTTVLPRIAAAPAAPAPAAPQRRRNWIPLAAMLLVTVLLIVGIAVAVSAAGDPPSQPAAPPQTTTSAAEIPVDGVAFTPRGSVDQADCAAHAIGDVRAWLEQNGCARLIRGRFETGQAGRRAAVLVGVLRFTSSSAATELRALADRPGSGGVVDAAVEGQPWPVEPQPRFESAAYASGREGNSVKVVQVVWLDQPSAPGDPALQEIAARALRLTPAG